MIYEGARKTAFILPIRVNGRPEDITDATVRKMIFIYPNGTSIEHDAVVNPGTADELKYADDESGTLIAAGGAGVWTYLAWLVRPGWEGFSDPAKFIVHKKLVSVPA